MLTSQNIASVGCGDEWSCIIKKSRSMPNCMFKLAATFTRIQSELLSADVLLPFILKKNNKTMVAGTKLMCKSKLRNDEEFHPPMQ